MSPLRSQVLDRGYANFRELRQREVRRIPLLGTWANRVGGPGSSTPQPSVAKPLQKLFAVVFVEVVLVDDDSPMRSPDFIGAAVEDYRALSS
jgi:hypothetical protein